MTKANTRFLLLSLLITVLAGLMFTPGLPGEFIFDDTPNITTNTAIHMTRLDVESLGKVLATPQVSGSLRALPTISFALDYWRGGGADPAVFKTTKNVIHALTQFVTAWFFPSLLLVPAVEDKRVRLPAPALALASAGRPRTVSPVLYGIGRGSGRERGGKAV